jgi:hypothetical protein
MPRPYTIARLAAAAGIHVETVRYYQRLRLVPEPLGGGCRPTALHQARAGHGIYARRGRESSDSPKEALVPRDARARRHQTAP